MTTPEKDPGITIIITEEMMAEADANHSLAEKFMARAKEQGKENASFDELLKILDEVWDEE